MHAKSAFEHFPLVVVLASTFLISCSGIRSRLNSEEANQVMRDIRSAETMFRERHAKFGGLDLLIEAGLLSSSLADGTEADYGFEVKAFVSKYEALAVPLEKDDQKQYVGWSFYLDESGVIRGRPFGKAGGYVVAGKTDPPVRAQ